MEESKKEELHSGDICIAETSFSFAEIRIKHNTVLSFILPMGMGPDLLKDGSLQTKYDVSQLSALCQI